MAATRPFRTLAAERAGQAHEVGRHQHRGLTARRGRRPGPGTTRRSGTSLAIGPLGCLGQGAAGVLGGIDDGSAQRPGQGGQQRLGHYLRAGQAPYDRGGLVLRRKGRQSKELDLDGTLLGHAVLSGRPCPVYDVSHG